MGDEPGVAPILQTLRHPPHDPEALHHLAQDERPRLRRQALRPRLDPKGPVELCLEQGKGASRSLVSVPRQHRRTTRSVLSLFHHRNPVFVQ